MARSRKARRAGSAAPATVEEAKPPVAVEPSAVAGPPMAGGVVPTLRRAIAMLDPATWFPPMWAFLCGAAASDHLGEGAETIVRTVLGMILVGPVLLGFAQVVHRYYDRAGGADRETEDAPPAAPTTLAPTQIILMETLLLALGVVLATALGATVAIIAAVGVALGILYSVPPLRLGRYGWLRSGIRALALIGLPWLAGTATLSADQWPPFSLILAALFTIGAYGTVTIADVATLARDRAGGTRTLPVALGSHEVAIGCCTVMGVAHAVVVEFAIIQGHVLIGGVLALALFVQWLLQRSWLAQPEEKAQWYFTWAVLLAMLVASFGIVAPAVSS